MDAHNAQEAEGEAAGSAPARSIITNSPQTVFTSTSGRYVLVPDFGVWDHTQYDVVAMIHTYTYMPRLRSTDANVCLSASWPCSGHHECQHDV
jgi:hypothetical protein